MRLLPFACLVGLLAACGEAPKPDMTPRVVTTAVVADTVPVYREYVGQVFGRQDVPIRARVEGWVEGLHFAEGTLVKEGQLLYTIDPQPFEEQVARMQSELAAARINATKAKGDLDRYEPLAAINAVSKSDLDAARAAHGAAAAKVEAAEANLRVARIQLDYTRVKSPISGLIGKTAARRGEFVGREPNPVIVNTVSAIDSVRVQFHLSERDYLYVARRAMQRASDPTHSPRPTTAFDLLLADGSLFPEPGHFDFMDRSVDPSTGTILVQVSFANPDLLVRPGQFAKVRVRTELRPDGVLVPQRAVREFQGRHLAYVVEADGTVRERLLKLGPTYGDRYLVEEGVRPGERIVLEGVQKVRDGITVLATDTVFSPKRMP